MEIGARFYHDLEKYLVALPEIEQECSDRIVNQPSVVRASTKARPEAAKP
jgi:hypothetical protein